MVGIIREAAAKIEAPDVVPGEGNLRAVKYHLQYELAALEAELGCEAERGGARRSEADGRSPVKPEHSPANKWSE